MKRVLSIFFALCITLAAMADAKGHYWLDVEDKNIPLEKVTDYFSEWFNLGEGVTFTISYDRIDNFGMRHIAYQQYIDGIKAEHQMILVHAHEGKIVSVNTSIIEADNQLKSIHPCLSKQQAKEKVPNSIGEAELLIITCTINGIETSRLAYKTIDLVNHEDVYVDAETGECIKRISRVRSADVQGRGNTMYNGWQDMIFLSQDDCYILADSKRNILTVDASNSNISLLNNFNPDNYNEEDRVTVGTNIFMNYVASCKLYTSTTSTWDNTAMLQAIYFSITNHSWYDPVEDPYPDLYIVIYDCDNNVVYTSPIMNDCKESDVLFYVSSGIPLYSAGYTIKIYDDDQIIDDLGESIKISNITSGIKTWKGTNVDGSLLIGRPELDAHWGMEKTYDFYKEVFKRNSYDNNGSLIYQFINSNINNKVFNNAAATITFGTSLENIWPSFINYGKVDCITQRPCVSLDLVAHEFTHLVTAYNGRGGLDPQGESAALDESFSDIMGFSVENYVLGDTDYLIGEDVMISTSNMRSMKNPNLSGDGKDNKAQPDTYLGDNWDLAGEVHKNCGVQNYWFYLLSEGGSGVNDNGNAYTVKGIGIKKAQQIAYQNLIEYILNNATYEAARKGSLDAVTGIYGKNSQEYISTANAWYAVGVGDAFEDMTDTPTGLTMGEYVVVAQRKANTNYFYMTSTPTNSRYTAVDTKTSDLNAVVAKDLGSEYVWTVVKNGETIQLKNGSQFSTWNGGNKAILGNTGKDLTVTTNEDGSFTLTFAESETVTRYLSLNADTKYDYFAYYGNTNQIEQLHFLPYTASATTNVEQVTVSNIHAYSIDNTIIVEAVDAMPVMVFNATGQCIFNEVVSSARVPATHGGMYLVKTPTEVVKVIVR